MSVEVLSDRGRQIEIQNSLKNLNELIGGNIYRLFNPSEFMQGFLKNISEESIIHLLKGGKINIDIVENNTFKKRISFLSLEDIKTENFDLGDISYDEINIYPVYE